MIRLYKTALAIFLLALCTLAAPPARAVQLAGVSMPDTQTLGAQTLALNGIGLRTYSIMHVHVYVAALYLPQPTTDAGSILRSASPKILRLQFVRNVSAAQVRSSWKRGLIANCVAPCTLDSAELDKFLATLKPVTAGENIEFIFTSQGLDAYDNGQLVRHVGDPQLAQLVLAVFIGPHAQAQKLKTELLGGH